MDFLIELLLWIFLAPIFEVVFCAIGYGLAKVFKKKKHNAVKPEKVIDHTNFVMKFNKDIKGLAWVMGIFMYICYLAGLIPIFFTYKNNEMQFIDFIIVFITLMIFLLITIFLMLYVLSFKIRYKNDTFYKYFFFIVKKINIASADYKTIAKKEIILYRQNKKILKLTVSLTNFNIAREILLNKNQT